MLALTLTCTWTLGPRCASVRYLAPPQGGRRVFCVTRSVACLACFWSTDLPGLLCFVSVTHKQSLLLLLLLLRMLLLCDIPLLLFLLLLFLLLLLLLLLHAVLLFILVTRHWHLHGPALTACFEATGHLEPQLVQQVGG